ncbi:GNAT family N-acetyltransferase [Lentzea sp. NPDC042327]|uniref:GNAT family N-acetyltransferase n=1 Tax=Lentzea sp. NPDC042327 TaxID=3154801 RepID=UPI00340271B3
MSTCPPTTAAGISLLRNGLELQPQRTVLRSGTGLVVAGDDHREHGWERVADLVVARNDAGRDEVDRRSRLTDSAQSRHEAITARGNVNHIGTLVERWHRGWTAADGLTSEVRDGHLVVHVDRPHRKYEWLATDEAEVAELAALVAATREPNWLSVPTSDPAQVVGELERAGLVVARPDETFMRRALAGHPLPAPPAGYAVEVTREPVLRVRVLAGGELAASGLMAVVGTDAVAHRIETAAGHRRRGLGSVVMGTLVHEALADGADTGLLFSSADGVHLYRRLGWERISDLVVAQNQVAARLSP